MMKMMKQITGYSYMKHLSICSATSSRRFQCKNKATRYLQNGNFFFFSIFYDVQINEVGWAVHVARRKGDEKCLYTLSRKP
jgi:hypothetical protein